MNAPVYIIDAARTPRGRGKAGKGALSGIHPQELLAQTLHSLQRKAGFDPKHVEELIVGVVSQVNEQGSNLARNTVLAAQWPNEVPGVTLNRFCGSGLQAVNVAAMAVASGAMDLAVAGGVESMSRVPMGSDGGGIDGDNAELRKRVFQVPQGISADLIATLEGFTREQLDAFALRSQQNAARAIAEKRFDKSLFAVKDPATGKIALERDEHPRADTTAEGLAALKASFTALGESAVGPNGETFDQLALKVYPQAKQIAHVHPAGNSSGIVDGAVAVALASQRAVDTHKLKPRARIRSIATLGTEPVIMLTGPAPVSLKALKVAGLQPSDVDLWEINEAFAAVVLQTVKALNIDIARVNVNGGAIALGHPLGATGAMLLSTAVDELERSGKRIALVTLCIGGGQGIATVIERVS
jgi:acetyl-CoA C-acetyltransferase